MICRGVERHTLLIGCALTVPVGPSATVSEGYTMLIGILILANVLTSFVSACTTTATWGVTTSYTSIMWCWMVEGCCLCSFRSLVCPVAALWCTRGLVCFGCIIPCIQD
jgi:hypothetical protein